MNEHNNHLIFNSKDRASSCQVFGRGNITPTSALSPQMTRIALCLDKCLGWIQSTRNNYTRFVGETINTAKNFYSKS